VKYHNKYFWGDLIQFIGLVFLGAGITMEFIKGGAVYLIGITAGAVIFAIGTKVKGR
jgi:hypothetical protein